MCVGTENNRLAIEADGYHHFIKRDQKWVFDGPTDHKYRMLKRAGWKVFSIPIFHWYHVQDQQSYLFKLLKKELLKTPQVFSFKKNKNKKNTAPPPGPPPTHTIFSKGELLSFFCFFIFLFFCTIHFFSVFFLENIFDSINFISKNLLTMCVNV